MTLLGSILSSVGSTCGLLHYNMRAKLFVEPPNSPSPTAGQAKSVSSEGTSPASGGTTGGVSSTKVSGPIGATLTVAQGASIQGNPAFNPNPISVKKGSVVQVVNKDSVPHTVTNGKGPDDPNSGKLFDTSIINAGESAKVDTSKLTSGQQYPFHCTCTSLHDWNTESYVRHAQFPKYVYFNSILVDIDPMQSQIFCSLQAITKKPKCFY